MPSPTSGTSELFARWELELRQHRRGAIGRRLMRAIARAVLAGGRAVAAGGSAYCFVVGDADEPTGVAFFQLP